MINIFGINNISHNKIVKEKRSSGFNNVNNLTYENKKPLVKKKPNYH
jgi:hypothetical protein